MYPRLTWVFPVILCFSASGAPPAGRSDLWLRGQRQDLWHLPPSAGAAATPVKVLYFPGDGGWRGFGATMAQNIAAWGYDVYGLDTKRYLSSFTGKTTLTEQEVMADFRTVAEAIAPQHEKVLLAGWSEGAGLSLLAASAPENRNTFFGLAAIGLGEQSVLGWKFADNITYITKAEPDEPHFPSLPYLPKVAPLRLALIHSAGDEYTTEAAVRKMFDVAGHPKKLSVVPARNHRFDGAQEEFFRVLKEGLAWIQERL